MSASLGSEEVGSLRSAIYFLAAGTHSGWLGGGTELEKHHATG